MTRDEAGEPGVDISEARREGYRRGLAVAFFWVAALATLYTAAWTLVETPKYREVFEQVRVPMPGLTMLLVEYYAVMAAGLTLGAVFCAFVTFSRKSDSRKILLLNGVLFVVALGWSALSAVAVKAPLLALFQGIGKGRP